jgi:hypothetical protein
MAGREDSPPAESDVVPEVARLSRERTSKLLDKSDAGVELLDEIHRRVGRVIRSIQSSLKRTIEVLRKEAAKLSSRVITTHQLKKHQWSTG